MLLRELYELEETCVCVCVCMYVHVHMCAHVLSHAWLFWDPMDAAHQSLLSMGLPKQEYWSGLSFPSPGDLPDPRTERLSPVSPASQADSLLLSLRGSLKERQATSKTEGYGLRHGAASGCSHWDVSKVKPQLTTLRSALHFFSHSHFSSEEVTLVTLLCDQRHPRPISCISMVVTGS